MKEKTKRLIATIVFCALCVAVCFGIVFDMKQTKTVKTEVEKPIVQKCDYKEETNVVIEEETEKEEIKQEPKFTYRAVEITATAYCPCVKCCGKSDGITATGVKAKANRTVAADPKYYPYGTEILCGMGEFVVEDCGGAIKGKNKVDFFFDTHEEALKFGRQEFTIWVKEYVK